MPGKKVPVRRRNRRNSRQAIVQAALRCFAARNYDGASMSDIAEATGITKRAIYRYFPTKRELFYAVRNEVYSAIVNHLWRELPPAKDFSALADALMRAHLRFGMENPEMLRIVVNTISEAATREFQENIDALLEEREEELEHLVRMGIEEGTLDPSLDPNYLAWVFILIFYFLTYMLAFEEEWILSRGEGAASVILRPILDSLAPPVKRNKPKKTRDRP